MVFKQLSEFFKQYPAGSSVIFSLILIILEKVVENEFVCPCVKGFTEGFFWCYLLVPMFVAFVCGLYLLSFECRWNSSKEAFLANVKKFFACLISSVVWLLVFFYDGRYWACLKTNLKSEHADSDERPPWEWCSKIRNLTHDQSLAEEEFFKSKLGGFGVLSGFSLIALVYKCCKNCCCWQKHTGKLKYWFHSCCKKCCCYCCEEAEEKPCCSDYGKTCGSAHCSKCCDRHAQNGCIQQVKCFAHPSTSLETKDQRNANNLPPQGSSDQLSGNQGNSGDGPEFIGMKDLAEKNALLGNNATASTSQGSSAAREENTALDCAVKPCGNKSCSCLCHQTCKCPCHKSQETRQHQHPPNPSDQEEGPGAETHQQSRKSVIL